MFEKCVLHVYSRLGRGCRSPAVILWVYPDNDSFCEDGASCPSQRLCVRTRRTRQAELGNETDQT